MPSYKTLEDKFSKDIVIATTTFYKNTESDMIRKDLTLKTFEESIKRNYSMIVVDGGSSENILQELTDLQSDRIHIEPQKEKGMGKGRRQAIKKAYESGKKFIGWMEPEKCYYIQELIKTIIPLAKDEADLVVPSRKSKLEDYPELQKYAELLGNCFFKKLTGLELDVWIGPRTWKREMTHFFLDYDGTQWGDKWDSIFIPLINMIKEGYRLKDVPINYKHPKEQTEIEEKNSLEFAIVRLAQLENLMNSMKLHWEN